MKSISVLLILVFFTVCNANAVNKKNQEGEKKAIKSEDLNTQRFYTWEVKTLTGNAKGVSYSESDAKKMIALFSSVDYLDFKIITSVPGN